MFNKLILALILWLPLDAALPNGTTWEVRHAGVDTNGGGFVTGSSGTDFSQQSAAQFAYTDMVLGTSGTSYTSVLHPVDATIVGNIVQVISGTGCTTGFFEITSQAVGVAQLDRSAGTISSTCTSNLGGALASLSKLDTAMRTTSAIQQVGWVKADATYSIGSAITIGLNVTASGKWPQINGYTTSRGDNGKPTFQFTVGSITGVSLTGANVTIRNFIFDCNSQATTTGFALNGNGETAENIKITNCTAGGIDLEITGNTDGICRSCWVTNTTGIFPAFTVVNGSSGGTAFCFYCIATGNSTVGFLNSGAICSNCIAANNSGASSDGFQIAGASRATQFINCVSYNNGRDGLQIFGVVNPWPQMVLNSIFVNNAGWGINNATGTTFVIGGMLENYNAFFGNGSGAITGLTAGANDLTLTGDPFTNGASNVFTLNNTAGAGTSARGAGYPGALIQGGTGFLDIGALQHASVATQSGFPIVQ